MDKTTIINEIIRVEGGYVNDPSDSGGETNYGITEAVARRYGYEGRMECLPASLAFEIYENKYWASLHLDEIAEISSDVAHELADTGINMGTGRAAEFLQRCLNALNNQGRLYPDLKVDGDVGPKTLSAFRSFHNQRGKKGMQVLLKMLNSLQGEFYISLAERRQKDEKFVYGWFDHRVA
ncbi:MAG: glycosyl hydrolase 108 family protein [Pseudomonadota bacterium]